MKYSDDIDFFYFLEQHGWSTCIVYVGGQIFQMGPTHIFENPIEVLLEAFTSILKGESKSEFVWHDEPGEYNWKIQVIPEQKHKVKISITNCELLQFNTKPSLEVLEFEVKLNLFCICIKKQMEKIQEMLAESTFKKNRENSFPHKAFKEFIDSLPCKNS